MRFRALLAFLGTVAGAALATSARDAHAVGTRMFELSSLEQLSGGDLAGVSVGSDGVVRAGWTLGNVPLPNDAGTTTTCAVSLFDGSVLVGTGPAAGGKVVRIANEQASIFADTKESAVSALAVDKKGTAYAATTSNKIFRLSQGKAEVWATLPDVSSVLALAFDGAGALYAGTGSEGRVLRLDPNGTSSVFFKTDDPFVVSLAVAEDGAVYAGTSGKGLLYRITAPGRATVLYDFPGEDVHAIAIGPNRTVWAIVNEGASGTPAEASESTSPRRGAGGRAPPGPSTAPRAKPGKGSLWRFDLLGRPERLMHHDEFHYLSLAVDERGAPYVGTGAEGRVYTVSDAHTVWLVADVDERQVGAIGVSGRARFIMGSDPAVFHRVVAIGGPDAVWTSKPLDAGLRARFGHLTYAATGQLEVSTRTGDTQTPDTTWSPWSNAIPSGGATANPPGRFVQVRARLRDAGATISNVTLAFVTENLRAVITEVAARAKGSTREFKEGIVQSGSEPPKHESVLHVTWRVDNPDNDELRYRVQFRREGDSRWLNATRPDDVLTKPELDWDTAALPEGKYRLRVDASDDISNPPGDATHHELEAPSILVDNTPPVFKSLAMQGHRLRAEVVDGVGPIARIEAAIDGRLEWRPLGAADGIFDTADETVDTDTTPLIPAGPGPHIVAVRAYDAAGNVVVREIETP
jgi:sugar lactone lactonase YvrE